MAELGEKISSALRKVNDVTIVDEGILFSFFFDTFRNDEKNDDANRYDQVSSERPSNCTPSSGCECENGETTYE